MNEMIPNTPPTWVEQYIGLPYDDGGRGPDVFDCFGLYRLVGNRHYALNVPSMGHLTVEKGLSNNDVRKRAATLLADRNAWPEVIQPTPGCAILLRIGADHCHVGLVVAVRQTAPHLPPRGHMLHITRGIRAACVEWHNSSWKNRIVSFHRYAGGEHG